MLEGSITTSQKSSAGNPFFSSKLTFYGTSKTLKNVNNTFDVDVAQQVVPADGMLRGTLTNDVSDYIDQMMMSVMSSKYPNNDGLAKITATITIVTTVKVWVPSTTTRQSVRTALVERKPARSALSKAVTGRWLLMVSRRRFTATAGSTPIRTWSARTRPAPAPH
jgi:hypothetical protein